MRCGQDIGCGAVGRAVVDHEAEGHGGHAVRGRSKPEIGARVDIVVCHAVSPVCVRTATAVLVVALEGACRFEDGDLDLGDSNSFDIGVSEVAGRVCDQGVLDVGHGDRCRGRKVVDRAVRRGQYVGCGAVGRAVVDHEAEGHVGRAVVRRGQPEVGTLVDVVVCHAVSPACVVTATAVLVLALEVACRFDDGDLDLVDRVARVDVGEGEIACRVCEQGVLDVGHGGRCRGRKVLDRAVRGGQYVGARAVGRAVVDHEAEGHVGHAVGGRGQPELVPC